MRGETLPVLDKRMETMDPDENEIYKFLGTEQAGGIKNKVVIEHITSEVKKWMNMLVNTKLNDRNLISAVNFQIIVVATNSVNVCKFNKRELNEFNYLVKRELRLKQMLGKKTRIWCL